MREGPARGTVVAGDNRGDRAHRLRRETTETERLLWARLRNRRVRGVRFRRQKPLGSYVVDLVSPEHKPIVELDGGRHRDQQDYDDRRARWLGHGDSRF